MIEVTNKIRDDFPNVFEKARKEKLRAVRLEPDLWYCARRAAGHDRYTVRFNVIPIVSGGEKVMVECRNIDGYRCKGTYPDPKTKKDRLCTHAAKVLLSSIAHGRRKLRMEKAA